MKHIVSAFALFILMMPSVEAYGTTSSSSGIYKTNSAYWNYVNSYYKKHYPTKTTSRTLPFSTYSRTTRSWNGVPSYRARTNSQTPTSTNSVRTNNYFLNRNSTSSLARVSVLPLPQRQALQTVDSTPIDAFEIGVHYSGGSSSYFQEAVELESLTLQMYGQSGIANQAEDFEILVNDSAARFDSNGMVILNFDPGVRVANGESENFKIQVRVRSSEDLPQLSGGFKLRVADASFVKELSREKVKAQITGQSQSEAIGYNPTGTNPFGSTGVFSTIPAGTIYGGNISAGEKKSVLALGFNAYFDDLYVRELVLKEKSGKTNVDVLIDTIQAMDAFTGEVFGSASFVNGQAKLRFNTPIFIPRREERQIVFVAQIEDPIPRGVDASFTLDVPASSLDVISYSNGNSVNLSNKNITLEEDVFTVVNSNVGVTYNNQLPSFAVNGSPNAIMRFQINNPGNKTISVSRLSFSVSPSGLNFPGGISTDDFELVALSGGGSEPSSPQFTPVSASGNTVVFDANNGELTIPSGSSRDFFLKAAFEDVGNVNDAVSVTLLKDSTPLKGTLSALKGAGARFIWSDFSGRPHTLSSSDFLSSFQLDGVGIGQSIKR